MLESGEIPQQETNHRERSKKNRPPVAKLLKYATLAPAAALSIFATGCRDQEAKISDQITPTAITRHLETTTPTLEKPTEIKSAGIDIQINSAITENVSPKGRSIDQDTAAIIEVALKLPLPDRFTVVLTDDYDNDRAIGPEGKIYIGRNRVRVETMQYEVAHELTHLLDPETNEEYLLQYYTPEQISDLKQLREEILNDTIWGRDYPSVEKIVRGKIGANVIPRPESSQSQIAAGTDIDANGIWIEGFNPFESDLADSHKLVDSLPFSDKEYSSLEEFAEANKSMLDEYFAASPLAKFAQADFYRLVNSGLFSPENTTWSAFTDNQAYLSGRYFKDWTKVSERITNMILFEKYKKGELAEFVEALPTSKQDFYRYAFESKYDVTDPEKFANVIATTVATKSEGPGQEYLQKMAYFNQVNNLPEE